MNEEKIICPKCGNNDTKIVKSWVMKNPKGNTETTVTLYLCRECGKKFRKGKRKD
ncbi:MAG: chorismate-binding protein [Candidatus Bathyarchaeota archaeon]|nr:chorismate-binding protein [Candidatus Bathyarchaeota archaeon]